MGKGLANCAMWSIADWLVPFRTGQPGFRSWLCHFTSRQLNLSKQEPHECVQSCALYSPAWRLLSKLHPRQQIHRVGSSYFVLGSWEGDLSTHIKVTCAHQAGLSLERVRFATLNRGVLLNSSPHYKMRKTAFRKAMPGRRAPGRG